MAAVKRTRERNPEKQGKLIDRIEAAAPRLIAKNSFRQAIIRGTKQEVRGNARPQATKFDFYAMVSAEELARAQSVKPIRRLGQLRAFSDPDPAQAEWFARAIRRWRREGLPRAVSR